MRVQGQRAAALLHRVINRPEVLAGGAPGYTRVDLTGFGDVPGNIVFGNEWGLILFRFLGDGQYEMHYCLTNSLGGAGRVRLIREAVTHVFTENGAHAIVGATPRINRPARMVNRALGGRPYGVCVDSQGRDCIQYVLERNTWATSSAQASAS